MSIKTLKIIVLTLLIPLLVFIFTPLDYTSVSYMLTHCWLVTLFGGILLVATSKKQSNSRKYRITTYIFLVFVTTIYLIMCFGTSHPKTYFSKVPKSKLVVTSNYYQLFLSATPKVDISVGYSILGGAMIWSLNNYSMNGEGSWRDKIIQYEMPMEIKNDGYKLFVLPENDLLLDGYENKVYKLKKKNTNNDN